MYSTTPLPSYHRMPDVDTYDAAMTRLRDVFGAASLPELAMLLGVTPRSMGQSRRHLRVPVAWLRTAFLRVDANPTWILEGVGPRRL